MRTVPFFVSSCVLVLGLGACDIEGSPAPGDPFGPADFEVEASERSDLEAVQLACASYCSAALDCALAADAETCATDCVEPMVLAEMNAQDDVDERAATEPPACDTEADEAYACTAEPACGEFEACDDAIDAYVGCMSAATE